MPRILSILAALIALATSISAPAAPLKPSVPIAVVGGTIIDPATGSATKADLLIVDGRIHAMGRHLRLPRSARIVNGRGRFIVPGLWDMHAHLAAFGPPGNAPERYVGYGVLAVRDMGGHLDVLSALRRAVMQSERIGPDIAMAGPTLNGAQDADFHRVVRTDAEARAAVREFKSAGVDFIKIHRQTTKEAFVAIADETRKLGLTFAGHVPLTMDWITASSAGMRTIEHVQTMIENEVVKGPDPVAAAYALARVQGGRGGEISTALASNRTYFTPTLVGYEVSWEKDPPARAALKKKFYAGLSPLVLRAARAGVPILAGTDVLERHGDMLLLELERLVAAGLSSREALAAATAAPRDLMGRGPGRIGNGEEASLLILNANPLADIRNIRQLDTVVLRGRVIDAAGLAQLRAIAD